MSYGMQVWDEIGQLGTDTSDVLGICLFAGYIAYTSPPSLTSIVISDVDDRPRLIRGRLDFNGNLVAPGLSSVTYDGTARTLTLANDFNGDPSNNRTFWFLIQW